ncbi:MAG: replication-associated recombination protein A [bacterium]
MTDLFQKAGLSSGTPRPLADRLRPQQLEEIIGQDHLIGKEQPLSKMLAAAKISSMILWGPPGVGKTTIARLIAEQSGLNFIQISAIFTGVADLRKVFDTAEIQRQAGQGTLLFVDEIHRFNRAQQDGFLPHVESGLITLIGATTENPSFELNAALLSRCQLFTLKRLDEDALDKLMCRAEQAEHPLPLTPQARRAMISMADGDGRFLYNLIESVLAEDQEKILDIDGLKNIVQRRAPIYDKSQEGHYNLISALHKSIRGSDADAALYWFARMLAGGEDPLYLARRLVRMASEDIGLADPHALPQAMAATQAYQLLGSPEGELALAQVVLYLATAPKSNAAYTAFKAANKAARQTGSLMPPKHAMNAPTKMMKVQGYSDGYIYDHDLPDAFAGLNYFPPDMARETFYEPVPRGLEKEIRKRLDYWNTRRKG